MRNKLGVIFIICLLVSSGLYAQTKRIDSLKSLINTTADPDTKLRLLLSLCQEKYSLSSDSLHHFATAAKVIAAQIHSKQFVKLADYYLTYSLLAKGREDSVISKADEQLAGMKYESDDKDLFAKYSILKGLALMRSNKSKESIDIFLNLLKEAEKGNDVSVIIETEMGLGNAYSTVTQYAETLDWNTKALTLCQPGQSTEYNELYAACLVRQGIAYLHLYESKLNKPFADSSRLYAGRALAICKKEEILFLLCQSLILTGYNLSYSNKPVEAELFLKEGLAVRKKIEDPIYIISDISVLGTFYAKTAQPDKGIAIIKEGLEIFKKNKMPAQLLVLLNNALAQNYRAAGDYIKYSETLNNLISLKDSIYKINSAEALSKLQAQYEVQKKENIIIQQKLNIVQKDYLFYSMLALFGLLLVFIFVLYQNYRKRQKITMEKVVKEQLQKETIAIMKAEEAERKRIAADLHDNLGAYAAAISANVKSFKDEGQYSHQLTHRIEENVSGMVNQLSDTIWVLKKENQLLTEISDRFKVWMQKLMRSYPAINYDFDEQIDNDVTLTPAAALHLFHMLQECVNNALKHSRCNTILIRLKGNQNKLQIQVLDNGTGFELNRATGGHGLGNLLQRATSCSWKINWENNEPSGTVVSIVSMPD